VRSLEKLLPRDERIYYSAHGQAIENPAKLVRGLILHRKQREAGILAQIEAGQGSIEAMVANLYQAVDPRLHPAAARSVLAHLIDLERRGLVAAEGSGWHRA
jgi:hypothetical protein